MRAAKFARDAWPEQTPAEALGLPDDFTRPRSWEELDCPDEIELELPGGWLHWTAEVFRVELKRADMSTDQAVVWHPVLPSAGEALCLTKQAEDCWYAGVPRGRRLVLRRI